MDTGLGAVANNVNKRMDEGLPSGALYARFFTSIIMLCGTRIEENCIPSLPFNSLQFQYLVSRHIYDSTLYMVCALH